MGNNEGNAPGSLETAKALPCKGRTEAIPPLARIRWRTRIRPAAHSAVYIQLPPLT